MDLLNDRGFAAGAPLRYVRSVGLENATTMQVSRLLPSVDSVDDRGFAGEPGALPHFALSDVTVSRVGCLRVGSRA